MILICVFSFFLLAMIAKAIKRKKTFWLFLFFSVALFYLSVSGLLPKILLAHLQNDTAMPYHTEFAEKNAIVVLGGGYSKISLRTEQEIYQTGMWTYSRIVAGAKSYFACKKAGKICFLILSGGDPSKTGHTEAELYKNEMLALGVPESDVILEDKSNNTFENAKFTAKIIFDKGVDPAIGVHLITSGFHIKRASQYFSFFYVNPRAVPADYFSVELQFIPVSSKNLIATDVVLNEYIGILRFYVYNLFGLNQH